MAQEAIVGPLRNAPVAEPRAYLRRSMVNQSNDGRRAVRERRYLSTLREDATPPPDVDHLWPLVPALPPLGLDRRGATVASFRFTDLECN